MTTRRALFGLFAGAASLPVPAGLPAIQAAACTTGTLIGSGVSMKLGGMIVENCSSNSVHLFHGTAIAEAAHEGR